MTALQISILEIFAEAQRRGRRREHITIEALIERRLQARELVWSRMTVVERRIEAKKQWARFKRYDRDLRARRPVYVIEPRGTTLECPCGAIGTHLCTRRRTA